MFHSGLTSITFRKLTAEQVIALAARAGLAGVEWGGDVHAPPGDLAAASRIARQTRDAGLAVSSYGSYYRLGQNAQPFEAVLETAQSLGAPIIRVWAGQIGSADADSAARKAVADDGGRIAEFASHAGVRIACEWHGGTLTDTAASAEKLFAEVAHPAFQTYWQPRERQSRDFCLRDMDAALPRLAGLHVFHWHLTTRNRMPLADGESDWRMYLDKAGKSAAAKATGDMFALLEFVANDDPEQMIRDAAALNGWLTMMPQMRY